MGQLTIIPGVEIIELGLQNHFPRAGAMRLRQFLLIFKVNFTKYAYNGKQVPKKRTVNYQ
jgi:hypothetical protein